MDKQTKPLMGGDIAITIIALIIILGLTMCATSIFIPLILFLALSTGWFIRTYRKTKSIVQSVFITGIVMVLLLGVIFLVLNQIEYICGNMVTTSVAFAKIMPQDDSITRTPTGEFRGVFINEAGKTIHVNDIRVFGHDGYNETKILCEETIERDVISGDDFGFKMDDCGNGVKGSVYNVDVRIRYDNGQEDKGSIRGPVEPGGIISQIVKSEQKAEQKLLGGN